MSKRPYSERLRNRARDPLWWIMLGSAVAAGSAGLVQAPFWLGNAFCCVLGLTFVAFAIRGKETGEEPMTPSVRLVIAVGGIAIVAFSVITIVTKL